MKPVAYLRLKNDPEYRSNAFAAGLEKAGYIVNIREPRRVFKGDLLVLWNLSGTNESAARAFKGCGGTVIVCENGYIGEDVDGRQLYAIAIDGHNGSGTWYKGGPSRLQALNLVTYPYQSDGRHILVCPNRYIGSKIMRMPEDWVQRTVEKLKSLTNREIRVRRHPGNWQKNPPKIRLEKDLEDCWAAVIWSSSAGVKALNRGIPVFCEAPYWICKDAANRVLGNIETPMFSDSMRQIAFEDMAWAQWTIAEITRGDPFSVNKQS